MLIGTAYVSLTVSYPETFLGVVLRKQNYLMYIRIKVPFCLHILNRISAERGVEEFHPPIYTTDHYT